MPVTERLPTGQQVDPRLEDRNESQEVYQRSRWDHTRPGVALRGRGAARISGQYRDIRWVSVILSFNAPQESIASLRLLMLCVEHHVDIIPRLLPLSAEKSAPHQSGTAYATTHRLFYIDATHPETRSFAMDLSHVARTEHYAGLFTSSPKVTLYLHPIDTPASPVNAPSGSPAPQDDPAFQSWTCDVCNYRNPPGLSPAASRICALCGVPRSDGPAASSNTSLLSSSLPSSTTHLARPPTSSSSSPRPASPPRGPNDEVACPICTFLNHPALTMCEMCGTPLPKRVAPPRASQQVHAKSAPASRPTSPPPDADGPDPRMIRLSFRKGGDKPFYAVLRRSLLGKGWEVRLTLIGFKLSLHIDSM